MATGGFVHSALLKGSSFRDCFISFPHHWKNFIQQASVATFMLKSTKNTILVSWSGRTHEHDTNIEEDTVYLSSRFMKINGLCEEDVVFIQQILCPPPCINVTMVLNSMPEWQEIFLNMDVAQDAFLSQVRVLKLNQKFPLWLEGGAVIYMKVKSFNPNSDNGLLQFNTLVEVLPPTENELVPWVNIDSAAKVSYDVSLKQKHKMGSLLDCFTILNFMYSAINLKIPLLPAFNEINIGLRYVPCPQMTEKKNILYNLLNFHPSLIIIGKQNIKHSIFFNKRHFISICNVKKNVKFPSSSKALSLHKHTNSNIMAIVLVWESLKNMLPSNLFEPVIANTIDLILKHETCLISFPLIRLLALNADHIVVMKSVSISMISDTIEVDAFPLTSHEHAKSTVTKINFQFQNICSICPIIINDMTRICPEIIGTSSEILITMRNKKAIYMDHLSVFRFTVNLITQAADFDYLPQIQYLKEDKINIRNVIIEDRIVEKLKHHILLDLNFMGNDQLPVLPQFALLQGGCGSGKTFIVEYLLNLLSRSPYFLHCEMIKMKQLKGKKVDSIQKLLKNVINKAVDLQPSLIIIDDLDVICSAQLDNDQEREIMNENLTHTTHLIKNMLNQVYENSLVNLSGWGKTFVAVVATCKFRDSINSHLSNPKGKHIFPKSFQIHPIDAQQKYELLYTFIKNYYEIFLKRNDLHEYDYMFNFTKSCPKIKIETLNLTDINNLARRIFLEGQSRWANKFTSLKSPINFQVAETIEVANMQCKSDACYFTDEDIENAFQGFIPLANKVLKLPIQGYTKKEVGGLIKAKEALEEMVLWPSHYPTLFDQATLSLRSGILLYGPPGCGKTHLVYTFANETNFNLITVKGPELLSKYIGQSEKAVREVFQRALAAKPSILFFDEFESIAPRRGHDSTGVTDRVVNQLLTQMDGAEGLTDVYVLAATSRPDLIDPAILRPGRLDKSIFCPIPDDNERLEILQALSKDILYDTEIDFKDIAIQTSEFTGADLQSLLSTAQVKAAQESVGSTLYEGIFDHGSKKATSEIEGLTFSNIGDKIVVDTSTTKKGEPTPEKCLNSIRDTDFTEALYSNANVYAEIVVMRRHINDALAEVKPSISASEKLKYETLHQMFNNIQGREVYDHSWTGRRETLA